MDVLSWSQAGTGSPHPDAVSATALSWTGRRESLEHQEADCHCCTVSDLFWVHCIRPWCPSSLLPPGDESRRNVHLMLSALCVMRLFLKRETCWPERSAFFSAETGILQSHLKRHHVTVMWIPCWSNCAGYDAVSAESRPLQVMLYLYLEDPPEQRNLSGTYSSKVTLVGWVSVCLAFSTQLGLCRQQISYSSTLPHQTSISSTSLSICKKAAHSLKIPSTVTHLTVRVNICSCAFGVLMDEKGSRLHVWQ